MCGIVGVVGRIGKTERDVFRQLLTVDALRGSDSTGVFTAKGKDVDVCKEVGDPYALMDRKTFDRVLLKPSNVLVGHNRYATTGKINRANAHPFVFPNVVGVHNGTLKNKYSLKDGNTFDVDSEALYHNFDLEGVKATIPQVTGAWSLAFYDIVTKEFNLLRNSERPMAFCYSEDRKTLFFASEGLMLMWILHRNGVKHTEVKVTATDTLYTISIKEEYEAQATPLQDFVRSDLKGKQDTFTVAPVVVKTTYAGAAASADNVVQMTAATTYLNQNISFYTEEHVIIDGMGYIRAELTTGDNDSPPVLVNVQAWPEKVRWLMRPDILSFKGRVMSTRWVNGKAHLVVNVHSVEEEHISTKKPEATSSSQFVGFNKAPLTMVQWRDLTAMGCIKCNDIPYEDEKDCLKWVSPSSFLCKYCH